MSFRPGLTGLWQVSGRSNITDFEEVVKLDTQYIADWSIKQDVRILIKRTYGYMFNMMIMDRELFDNYCSWVFDILFELKKRCDMPELSPFQRRYFGRVSEIIFNVWLEQQLESGRLKKNQVKELRCIHMEKINWLKKGKAFLKAKFFSRKYEGSF